MALSDKDIKHYENVAELVQLDGWKELMELVATEVKNLEEHIWFLGDDRQIAHMQGHRNCLVWLRDYQANKEKEFVMLQEQALEDEVDADL